MGGGEEEEKEERRGEESYNFINNKHVGGGEEGARWPEMGSVVRHINWLHGGEGAGGEGEGGEEGGTMIPRDA